ncbi:hypothetical protein DL93DRAFT_670915 [Clavulina sp. PMI_390]|nr:hypothetical protein DL93DRAFT_670915 [Clavulina sp. PMI_390]
MAALLPPSSRPRFGETHPLQGAFYSSSLFVDPLRQDIDDLLRAFVDRCKVALSNKEDPKPFRWYKEIWVRQKWDFFHLRCIQNPSRKSFLEVTFRCFLGSLPLIPLTAASRLKYTHHIEKISSKEPVLHRLTALFAIYTLFTSQSLPEFEKLYSLRYIPIAQDLYEELVTLPGTLPPLFDHYATYTVQSLVSRSAFVILPDSILEGYSSAMLPDSTLAIVDEASEESGKVRGKAGRPRAMDLQRRATNAVSALDAWSNNAAPSLSTSSSTLPAISSEEHYHAYKQAVAEAVDRSDIEASEQSVMDKMKQLEDIWVRQGWNVEDESNGNSSEGLRQLEKAQSTSQGLLGLSRRVNENLPPEAAGLEEEEEAT